MELNRITSKLQIELDEAKKLTKNQWKELVKGKILIVAKEDCEAELAGLKGYSNNVKDEIVVGKKKRYVSLSQKKAKVWFRMRANIIDPAPRQPYHPKSKWKCKFCNAEDQSTEHYVKNCDGIEKEVFNGINRDTMYSAIQTLDCDEMTFLQTTYSIQKIYDLINK